MIRVIDKWNVNFTLGIFLGFGAFQLQQTAQPPKHPQYEIKRVPKRPSSKLFTHLFSNQISYDVYTCNEILLRVIMIYIVSLKCTLEMNSDSNPNQ